MATIIPIDARRRTARTCLKSRIDARAEVLPSELLGDLEGLAREYTERFRPATLEERFLVDILIRSEWRLRRFAKIESERIQRGIDAAEISYLRALRELRRLQSNGGPTRGKRLQAA